MLLKTIKSQPKISYLESVAKAHDSKSTTSEALSTASQYPRNEYGSTSTQFLKTAPQNNFPKWSRSEAKFDKMRGFSDNEYQRCVKISKIMEEKNEENSIELPQSMLEAFQKKLAEEIQNTDLPISPKSDNKKRRPKSSDCHSEAFERLYQSPSPYKSKEDLGKCYMTEKGKKRLHSVVTAKIPKKTLYYIDKLVRDKLKREKIKMRKSGSINKEIYEREIMSPQAKGNDEILKETREMLDFMTPVKGSMEAKARRLHSPNNHPIQPIKGEEYAGTKFAFDPSCAWDSLAYEQIKSKLLEKVKEEIISYQILTKAQKDFENYETRLAKMKQWERNKLKEQKSKKREKREKSKLEKEMKQRKRENGEQAFRDWLKRSMELKTKENRIKRETLKSKKKEQRRKKEMEKKTKSMSELAFKEWCNRKKTQKKLEKKKLKEKGETYEERERKWRQRNILMSKKNSGVFRPSSMRKKSRKRSSKKKPEEVEESDKS